MNHGDEDYCDFIDFIGFQDSICQLGEPRWCRLQWFHGFHGFHRITIYRIPFIDKINHSDEDYSDFMDSIGLRWFHEFYRITDPNSSSLQSRRHPMKCNQWDFCFGISNHANICGGCLNDLKDNNEVCPNPNCGDIIVDFIPIRLVWWVCCLIMPLLMENFLQLYLRKICLHLTSTIDNWCKLVKL